MKFDTSKGLLCSQKFGDLILQKWNIKKPKKNWIPVRVNIKYLFCNCALKNESFRKSWSMLLFAILKKTGILYWIPVRVIITFFAPFLILLNNEWFSTLCCLLIFVWNGYMNKIIYQQYVFSVLSFRSIIRKRRGQITGSGPVEEKQGACI
jgi:hypothetical protein